MTDPESPLQRILGWLSSIMALGTPNLAIQILLLVAMGCTDPQLLTWRINAIRSRKRNPPAAGTKAEEEEKRQRKRLSTLRGHITRSASEMLRSKLLVAERRGSRICNYRLSHESATVIAEWMDCCLSNSKGGAFRKKAGTLERDELQRMLEVGQAFHMVAGKIGDLAARSWLLAPNSGCGNKPPIEYCASLEGAKYVSSFLKAGRFDINPGSRQEAP